MANDVQLEVLHRDAHFLVVNKPTGLPTTSPEGLDSLARRVPELDPDAPRLHPSSRLDAEVTGVVTFARTRKATKCLLAARKRGAYARTYLALSASAPEPNAGTWRGRIALDAGDPRKRRWLPELTDGEDDLGQPAHTDYETRVRLDEVALLALFPRTGRTHQLRVHAAAAGVPLLGDRHYGGCVRCVLESGRVVRIARVMLHCAQVVVPDPDGSGLLTFRAPVPDDMQQAYTRLGGDLADLAKILHEP